MPCTARVRIRRRSRCVGMPPAAGSLASAERGPQVGTHIAAAPCFQHLRFRDRRRPRRIGLVLQRQRRRAKIACSCASSVIARMPSRRSRTGRNRRAPRRRPRSRGPRSAPCGARARPRTCRRTPVRCCRHNGRGLKSVVAAGAVVRVQQHDLVGLGIAVCRAWRSRTMCLVKSRRSSCRTRVWQTMNGSKPSLRSAVSTSPVGMYV